MGTASTTGHAIHVDTTRTTVYGYAQHAISISPHGSASHAHAAMKWRGEKMDRTGCNDHDLKELAIRASLRDIKLLGDVLLNEYRKGDYSNALNAVTGILTRIGAVERCLKELERWADNDNP
jgi:hypothetical protein